MPYWFTRLVGLLPRDRRFRVHMGNDTSSWRPQRTAFLKTLSLHRFCSNCTPTTYQLHVAENSFMLTTYVSPFKANTSANWNAVSRQMWHEWWMSHFCRQWRLKPSASKIISSVFHLHNTGATRELSVYLDGQRLRHDCHPTYLGVTLDRTLSYRVHLTKTAGKLKNRNNLLMKLAGFTWGASANTLRSSALALCYSAAEYCAAVWSRSVHTSQVDVQLNSTMRSMCSWTLQWGRCAVELYNEVDVQLNSTMRLISGTLRSTPLPWLPVLSNIEPPALRGKAATEKLVEKIVKHDSWPMQPDILSPPLLRLTSRKPLWLDLQPVDIKSRWRHNWKLAQVVNSHVVCDPTIRQPGFDLPQQQWSLLNRFRMEQFVLCMEYCAIWHI